MMDFCPKPTKAWEAFLFIIFFLFCMKRYGVDVSRTIPKGRNPDGSAGKRNERNEPLTSLLCNLHFFISISGGPSEVEGYPMRAWSIKIHLLDEHGKEGPASVFEKVTYKLHPSFKNPIQGSYPFLVT
jgi:hypothetical protein